MTKKLLSTAIFGALLITSGCASVIDGTHETVSVNTTSDGSAVSGAYCTLENDKGNWSVTTPGTAEVHRSGDKLDVTCNETGFTGGSLTVEASTSGAVYGNIAVGGLIGLAIDQNTGAAYKYPSLITVPLLHVPAPVAGVTPKPVS